MSTIFLPSCEIVNGDQNIIQTTNNLQFPYRVDNAAPPRMSVDANSTKMHIIINLDESLGKNGSVTVAVDRRLELRYSEAADGIHYFFA